MIVVHGSALVAVVFGRPCASSILRRLAEAPRRIASAVGLAEAGALLARRRRQAPERAIEDLHAVLIAGRITAEPADAVQARLALEIQIQQGADLSGHSLWTLGDCFTLALAAVREAPLLTLHRLGEGAAGGVETAGLIRPHRLLPGQTTAELSGAFAWPGLGAER